MSEIILGFVIVIVVEMTTLLVLMLRNGGVRKFSFGNNTGQKRKIYVDTSALMDGRILEVARTGFIGDNLIIPRSVIRELQLLADGKDSEKRTRARFGLDVVNELERVIYCDTTILQDALDKTLVDERLIELAKENRGLICTVDFNLGKVAATEKIDVLNVNDLAMVLRSEYSTGEKFKLKITTEGSGAGQGVGHLQDGTMVVVEGAKSKVGREVEVELIRFLQTETGRMIFAKLVTKEKKQKLRRGVK